MENKKPFKICQKKHFIIIVRGKTSRCDKEGAEGVILPMFSASVFSVCSGSVLTFRAIVFRFLGEAHVHEKSTRKVNGKVA